MIKKNKLTLIITSLICLAPMAVGLILRNKMPESIVSHWGADGTADGFAGRGFAVFVLPLIMLALHLICVLVTVHDPKNKDQSKKAMGMVYWIMPVMSLFVCATVYGSALGLELRMGNIMPAMIGLMFIVLGNYLPKCKQNSTLGIKLPWTLADEENWNKTHRFAAKFWVVGGFVLLASIFFSQSVAAVVMCAILIVLIVIPTVYSFVLFKKAGGMMKMPGKTLTVGYGAALAITAVILVGVAVVFTTGNISYEYGDSSFAVSSAYWDDIEVDYSAVDSLEYREDTVDGYRVNGFGSPRLQMGTFENEEFGLYTRYTYTACEPCIVMTVDGMTLVLGAKDEESTKAVFDELNARIA